MREISYNLVLFWLDLEYQRNIFQIEMALDAFKRNNVTLDWFSIPHNTECVYDMSPSCKDDF